MFMKENRGVLEVKEDIKKELNEGILPFWLNYVVKEDGSLYGEVTNDNVAKSSSLGGIQVSRLLWSLSAVARAEKHEECLQRAHFVYDFIRKKLYDKEYGGIYWNIQSDGTPIESKKQIYAIAFCIYGLSEYYAASGKQEALDLAVSLFYDIEKHSFDTRLNGYYEAYSRTWGETGDIRLSEKDEDAPKTMNTHLHILEAYTLLYSVWKNSELEKQLRNLIELFLGPFLNQKTGHFELFFDDNWNSTSKLLSYGHDVEATWLIEEAARSLEDPELIARVQKLMLPVIETNLKEGIQIDGSMIYESENHHFVNDRHWWVQVESMVGFYNAYQYSGNTKYLEVSLNLWSFIKQYIVAPNGEWYWGVTADYKILPELKAGFWKCPYHNSRACLEMIKRIK
jgi:mannobiose 2-epimerase